MIMIMIMIITIVVIIITIIVLGLPGFSKFLERIIYNHLYDYLTNLHLCNKQFGFRKNHSTTLALIDLHEKNFICYWSWWISGWCLFRSLESFLYSQSFHLIW